MLRVRRKMERERVTIEFGGPTEEVGIGEVVLGDRPGLGNLAGSLGVAPTGNVDPERRFPSMFEPIHGSAFDITGKGIANPVATFWTGAQMLEHLGEPEAAARLMRAVERVTAAGILTPDLGGTATTREVTDAVCDAIHSANS